MVEHTQSTSPYSGSSIAGYSVVASIDECKANGDVNGKEDILPDSESTNAIDVYAKVNKGSKKIMKDTDQTDVDETLMVENDDLYENNAHFEPEVEYNSESNDEHIYDFPNKGNNGNIITNDSNNVLENERDEQNDKIADTEEKKNVDHADEKEETAETITSDRKNSSFENVPNRDDDESDNDSVVMYENSEIYSSSVDLNEEGEVEEILSDAVDDEVSESSAKNTQQKMPHNSDSDIKKENEMCDASNDS